MFQSNDYEMTDSASFLSICQSYILLTGCCISGKTCSRYFFSRFSFECM